MATQDQSMDGPEDDARLAAQRAADSLALALEDVGFDVGQAYPQLRGEVSPDGGSVVELGWVTAEIASSLASVLARAAKRGVTL
jgi:hypothetical protein